MKLKRTDVKFPCRGCVYFPHAVKTCAQCPARDAKLHLNKKGRENRDDTYS